MQFSAQFPAPGNADAHTSPPTPHEPDQFPLPVAPGVCVEILVRLDWIEAKIDNIFSDKPVYQT